MLAHFNVTAIERCWNVFIFVFFLVSLLFYGTCDRSLWSGTSFFPTCSQCCGSMTFSYGSGSCYFCHWPSRCQQKTKTFSKFSAYFFLKVHLHHFSKLKNQKKSENSRNQGFAYYFCLMIEGSGSIPLLTKGSRSGSRRPKNMRIRWNPMDPDSDPDPQHCLLPSFSLI